jgi:hypothetical protein
MKGVLVCSLLLAATHDAVPAAAYRTAAIHAYLYYQSSGSFDERDITSGKLALRNVLIGAGDSLAPSGAILISVDVEGPTFAKTNLPALEVTTTTNGKRLSVTRVPLGDFFSESARISVPILVYGVFCSELRIVARVQGAPKENSRSVLVPFQCGE